MRTRIAVFLITLSGLILEVGLTRIYSASIWYHFAFVAISVALLGWGLGGFTVHLWKQVGGRRQTAGEAEGGRQKAVSYAPSPTPLPEGEGESGRDGRVPRTLSIQAAALTTLL